MTNIDRAMYYIGREGESYKSVINGKTVYDGNYIKNGQKLLFVISSNKEFNFTMLTIRIHNERFEKIFRGKNSLEDAGAELLAAFRRIEGAAEFFRDYRKD